MDILKHFEEMEKAGETTGEDLFAGVEPEIAALVKMVIEESGEDWRDCTKEEIDDFVQCTKDSMKKEGLTMKDIEVGMMKHKSESAMSEILGRGVKMVFGGDGVEFVPEDTPVLDLGEDEDEEEEVSEVSEDRAAADRILAEEGIGAAMAAVMTGKHKRRKAVERPKIDPTRLDEVPDELMRDLVFSNTKITAAVTCATCGRIVKADGFDADRMLSQMEELVKIAAREGWGNHPYREDGKLYCPNCVSKHESTYGLTTEPPRAVQFVRVREIHERVVALEEATPQDALERFIIGEQYDYSIGDAEVITVAHTEGFCGVCEIRGNNGSSLTSGEFFGKIDDGVLSSCLQVCGLYEDEDEEGEGE